METRTPETEAERSQNLMDEERMKNAQRFAKMLSKQGRAEEELAIYIEYAWVETPDYMRDDIRILEKWRAKAATIHGDINTWARKRYGKR